VRMQNPTGILVTNFPTADDRVYFLSCASIVAFGGV
jgi:hypothetical protein